MLGLKLIYVNKRGPWSQMLCNRDINIKLAKQNKYFPFEMYDKSGFCVYCCIRVGLFASLVLDPCVNNALGLNIGLSSKQVAQHVVALVLPVEQRSHISFIVYKVHDYHNNALLISFLVMGNHWLSTVGCQTSHKWNADLWSLNLSHKSHIAPVPICICVHVSVIKWFIVGYWCNALWHDDAIKWKHFPRYWPFVRWIHRWIPHTKASDAELWCFLWSAPE